MKSRLERFQAKYRIDPVTGCWEWTGAKYYNGYGVFGWSHEGNHTAHRASWLLHREPEIADKLDVCHHCDNRGCVNPDHLFVGTRRENMMDRVRKGRHPRRGNKGTINGRAKLNDEKVRAIRAAKTTNLEEARKYGMAPSVISAIRSRKNWTHVGDVT